MLITVFSPSMPPAFHGVYFTAAIERVMAQGTPVGFALTDGLPWIETDVPVELERARQEIYPQIVRLGSSPG